MTAATTTPVAGTWHPGSIYRAWLALQLADGTSYGLGVDVLILDVRPGAGDTTRVLWVRQGPEGPHVDRPRWATIDAATGQARDKGIAALSLQARIGAYTPRDPAYNSLEILRDQAIARVHQHHEWRRVHRPADLGEAATAAARAEVEAQASIEHRDNLIRAKLDAGVSARDIATTVRLKVARIYQIRDHRR